jgi:hypothetical protein
MFGLQPRRNLARTVALALLVLALGSCDAPRADGPAVAVGGSPSTSAAAGRDGRAWAQCMRDNGIPVPDPDPVTGQLPGFDKGSQDRDKFTRATAACAALEPVSEVDHSPLTASELAQMREWTACMRQHQVPVPDPDPNDPFGPHFERLPNMPPAAVLDEAMNACHDKLPPRVSGE